MSNKKRSRGGNHVRYSPADGKKNFFRRVESICTAVAGQGAFGLIPPRALTVMYRTRILPIKVLPAAGEVVPVEVLKEMRKFLADFLGRRQIPLFKGGPKLPFAEFVSAEEALRLYLRELDENPSDETTVFRKAMERLAEFSEGSDAASKNIEGAISLMELNHNDLGSRLYWLEHDMRLRPHEPWGIENNILVHSSVPERKQVTLDGIPRPATRVSTAGGTYEGVIRASIAPDRLGIACGREAGPMGIYIQEHALRRLAERIDCVTTGTRDLSLCCSFVNPRYHRQADGTLLIDFMFFESKAGYLVAEATGGDLVIRTFLFLTNGGTPEGNRLRNLCEMGRADIDVLSIDRLSTFMATDFRADRRLESMFVEAGCGSLLELREKSGAFNTRRDMESALPMLVKYFGLDSKGDFMMPDTVERFRRKFDEAREPGPFSKVIRGS